MKPATAPQAGRIPPRWHAVRLLDAPHRLCFFWAGWNWAAAAAWWAACLGSAALGTPWPWRLSAASAHGLWFSLGAMPLFIAGFMFTAGPKWLRRPAVDARRLLLPVGLFTAGWGVAVAGFHLGLALAAAGLAMVALGWGGLTWRIVALVAGSAQADRRHPWLIALACILIGLCLCVSSLLLAAGQTEPLRALLQVALWGGVTAVFLVVSHRLLPFLGAGAWPWLDARWPDWTLWLVVSVPLLRSASASVEPWQALPLAWRAVEAAHLAAVAAVCLLIVLRCTRMPALQQPLVAMLFGAFAWWDIALWLGAAARLPALDAHSAAALELAAVHALTLGYLGGTLLVMATRVSSTHSGRPVAIDRVTRALYAALQGALLMRLLATSATSSSPAWLLSAAAAWMGVAMVWAVRHGRWLGTPRADGRPG